MEEQSMLEHLMNCVEHVCLSCVLSCYL